MHRLFALIFLLLFLTPLLAYDVILKSGKKISGTLIREDAQVLILKDTAGMYHNFKKADIDLEKTASLNKTKPDTPAKNSKRVYTKQDLDRVRQEYDLGQGSYGESSEVDIQEDIEFALIQMKSETLNKINEALRRLDEGTYGNCFECGDGIAEARLRALPFAVRCKDCEEARETAEQRERMLAQKRGSSTLFFDMSN